jgi:hypothetical protein
MAFQPLCKFFPPRPTQNALKPLCMLEEIAAKLISRAKLFLSL